jgi:hypothetical protein
MAGQRPEMPQDTGSNAIQALRPQHDQTPVAFDGSAQSSAFDAATQVVRLVATQDCHLAFGTNPTATISAMILPALAPEYFKVLSGEKVAAIKVAAGTAGNLHVTEMA